MEDKRIDFNNKDQIIYIPAYVEQGTEILKITRNVLEDIATDIQRGIRKIQSSGYNREIPYIENGGQVASAIASMGQTIKVITNELKEYSRGRNILPADAIIVADEDTARKYRINKNNIYCSLKEFNEMPRINPRWETNYLTASAGSNKYYGKDGRCTKETWCDLDPRNLATLMRKQGIDLDFWIREDGVYMYGDYVMVAADIPHMDGTQQEAEYRKGDIVETSLGTGMVVDLCGMAENVRKGVYKGGSFGDIEVWYDIYTAWHEGGMYSDVGYRDPTNSLGKGVKTMISAGSTPSSLYHSNSPLQTAGAALVTTPFLFQEQAAPQATPLANSVNATPTYQAPTPTNQNPTYQAPNPTNQTPTPQVPLAQAPITQTATYSYNDNNGYGTSPNVSVEQVVEPTPTPQPTLLDKIVNLVSPDTKSNVVTQNITPVTTQQVVEENIQIPTPTTTYQTQNINTPAVTATSVNNMVPESTTNQPDAIPILASLGLATAASVSSKIYLDEKNNKSKSKEKDSSTTAKETL